MSPTAAGRAGEDQVLARDGHQPARLRPVQRVVGDHAIDGRDLGVEEIDLAQPAVLKAVLSASPSAGKNALVFGRTPSQRFEPWTVSALAERAGTCSAACSGTRATVATLPSPGKDPAKWRFPVKRSGAGIEPTHRRATPAHRF